MEMLYIGGTFEPAVNNVQGCSVNFFGGGATVVLTMEEPTKEEIQEVTSGSIMYKLSVVGGIPLFMIKYGTLPWMEMPILNYEGCKLELFDGQFEEGVGYILNTILCDVPTGVIKAMRAIGMESGVSNGINQSIEQGVKFDSLFDNLQAIVAVQNKYTQDEIIEKAKYHGEIIKND